MTTALLKQIGVERNYCKDITLQKIVLEAMNIQGISYILLNGMKLDLPGVIGAFKLILITGYWVAVPQRYINKSYQSS